MKYQATVVLALLVCLWTVMAAFAALHPGDIIVGSVVVTGDLQSAGKLRQFASDGSPTLTWSPVNGNPTAYDVRRKAGGTDYGTPVRWPTSPYTDTSVVSNTAYVYQVRAVNSPFTSAWSAPVLATTNHYTHPAAGNHVSAGDGIAAADIIELRAVVNSVCAAAGSSAPTYTDPDLLIHPVTIRLEHISQLRAALDEARLQLVLPAATYSDQPLIQNQAPVKATHINELRDGVQ